MSKITQITANFHPTTEQVRIAEAVVVAMANESLIRPVVEHYETEILAKHQFPIAPRWLQCNMPHQAILDRKRAYLLSEDDAKTYYEACYTARDAAGLKVNHPENCPLLEAENLRIDAENALLTTMGSIPGLESFSKTVWPLDLREKAINLSLHLLAPFMDRGDQILARLTSA